MFAGTAVSFPHKLAVASMLLAAATIAAGFFVLTISGGYPHNGPWLLAHSFSLGHAVDNSAAICSIMTLNAVAIFVVVIGLFSAAT